MGDRQVLALESLLRDAVRNLVENAVKHTPAGSAIVVSVDNSTIAVRDQGATTKVDVIATTASKSAGGLGIGLEIVRRIAALHGAQFEMARDNSGTLARLVFDARRAG
jgi:signal transduction histidine kinase